MLNKIPALFIPRFEIPALSRDRGFIFLKMIYIAFLSAVMFYYLWNYLEAVSSGGKLTASHAAHLAFISSTYIQMMLTAGLCMVVFSESVIQYKADKKIEALLLAGIGKTEFFAGKILSNMILAATLTVLYIPILCPCILLGGVTGKDMSCFVLLNLSVVCLSQSVCLFWLGMCRRRAFVLLLSLITLLFLWKIIPYILSQQSYRAYYPILTDRFLIHLNPLTYMHFCKEGETSVSLSSSALIALIWVGISLPFGVVGVQMFHWRPSYAATYHLKQTSGMWKRFLDVLLKKRGAGRDIPVTENTNIVDWKNRILDRREGISRIYLWHGGVILIASLLTMLFCISGSTHGSREIVKRVVSFDGIVVMAVILYLSVKPMSNEKSHGSSDFILLSCIRESYVVWGFIVNVFRKAFFLSLPLIVYGNFFGSIVYGLTNYYQVLIFTAFGLMLMAALTVIGVFVSVFTCAMLAQHLVCSCILAGAAVAFCLAQLNVVWYYWWMVFPLIAADLYILYLFYVYTVMRFRKACLEKGSAVTP